jgi:acyl-CoA thioesterase-1
MEASLNRFGLSGYGAGRGLRNLSAAFVMALPGVAMAEAVTVAALGDSLTQGYGLLPEEGFVPQLEAWLREQGADVALINAGVSGDTTAGGLARVGWTLVPEVDAMIVALGGNDLLRGIDPAASRENLRGILEAAQAAGVEVLLVGMEAPTNYGPEFKAAFDTMYGELAAEFGAALYPSFFDGLMAEGDLAEARARYMQGDGIHPNAEGVGVIVAAMGPAVLELVGP